MEERFRLESEIFKTLLITEHTFENNALESRRHLNSMISTKPLECDDIIGKKLSPGQASINNLTCKEHTKDGPQVEPSHRISFMTDEPIPHQALMVRSQRGSVCSGNFVSPRLDRSNTILSGRSNPFSSRATIFGPDDLGGHETKLLDMVRTQIKGIVEAEDKAPTEPPTEEKESDEEQYDSCVHGMSMRFTERSVSRSRFSRISTKRDMDIPSILAFTPTNTAPTQLEIPDFKKIVEPQQEDIPRWSIRRSVCPVCSQKWRDRSAIKNVKSSGLKRGSASDFPTIIAPARLRAAVNKNYEPRPTLAVVDEGVPGYRSLRNTSTTWQLTRARKFRTPKLQMPSPDDTAPPAAAAPMARKDLDIRVSKFLADEK